MLRIGIAQIDITLGDRKANFRRVEEWMEKHCAPSDIETAIVLPEIFDVGYVIDEAQRWADPEASEAASFLGGLAKRFGVWFAGGSVLASSGGAAFNRALVINPDGNYISHYDKVHLVPMMDEDKYLRGGASQCYFEIGGVKCCCAICYDLRFCEWFRMAALDGAQLCFLSAEWPEARIEHWKVLLRARAVENMMFVAACNRTGESPSDKFGGHSAVIDPWGAAVYECGAGEDAVFVNIEPEDADKARRFIKAFDMRRPELYKL